MVEDMTKDYSYLMSGANQDMEFRMMFSAVVHNIAADRLNAMGTNTLPLTVSNKCICTNDSFTLSETGSGMGSDSDSKPNGYIVLYRTCSHCTDLDPDPYSLFLYKTGIRVRVCTRVRLR